MTGRATKYYLEGVFAWSLSRPVRNCSATRPWRRESGTHTPSPTPRTGVWPILSASKAVVQGLGEVDWPPSIGAAGKVFCYI